MASGTGQFCPNCGSKATTTQKFCRACGADLAGDQTQELSTPAAAEATVPIRPPAGPQQVAPSPPRGEAPAWPAWTGAAACGVLVIATGLPWFGGVLSADGFDVPLAALFSDTGDGGVPIGVLFVVAAAAGLAVALIKPDRGVLTATFLSVGAVSTVFALWYIFRVLSTSRGAPVVDLLSVGVWILLLASLVVLVSGFLLRFAPARR